MAKRNKTYRVVVHETDAVEYEVAAINKKTATAMVVDYGQGVEVRRDYVEHSCKLDSIEEVKNAKV
jgi:hypothetical protein